MDVLVFITTRRFVDTEMRFLVLAVIGVVALATSSAYAGERRLQTVDDAQREIRAVVQDSDKISVKEVDTRLKAVLAAKTFSELTINYKLGAYLIAGAAKLELGDARGATPLLAKATDIPGAPKEAWRMRLVASADIDDVESAVTSLRQLALHWPAELSTFNDEAVGHIVNRARFLDNGRRKQLDLLDAMNGAGWKPSDPIEVADGLWVTLAIGLIEDGNAARAATVAQRITFPWELAAMRADRRLDTLFDHGAPQFDPELAVKTELNRNAKLVADHPDELSYIVAYSLELLACRQPDAALKLLDDAASRIKSAPKDKPAYTDLDKQLIWLKDYRSRALFDLGRNDDGLAMLIEGAAEDEGSTKGNVSQLINLAGKYNDLGRPQKALDELSHVNVKNTSPYGAMQLEKEKALAFVQIGDKRGLAKSLAYLRVNEKEAPSALVEALIDVGDLEGVADIFKRRLADPDERYRALRELQDFAGSPNPTPTTKMRERRWRELVQRPDMRAAVEKVGRINSYTFMDYPG
jgi:tetratricopeptide (TPR) repeat protein